MDSSSIFPFDLNLPPPPESDETHLPPPAVKSNNGVNQEEDSNEKMEIGPEEGGEIKKNEKFSALVEVAGIISGDGSDPTETSESMNNSGGIEGQGNASEAAAAAGEEERPAAAAGRRKSGRVQVLPSKYKDSVVEVLTSQFLRQNESASSASSADVPAKRRRRTR